ncbi:MAG TPA: tetratricopeptide repeat protein [Pyrinomonadaceae bacterium]
MSPLVRLATTLVALIVCLCAFAAAGRAGFSRFLIEESLTNNSATEANEAVRLAPDDPQVHFARGVLLRSNGELAEAIVSFKRSIELRRLDTSAWLELGKTYQAKGDLKAAIDAFSVGVQVAPYYAEPRWLLGNSLLNNGQTVEAFRELRVAAQSDPELLQPVIELAWKAFGGVPQRVVEAIEPKTEPARVTLGSFLIKENQMKEGLELLSSAGRAADYDRWRLMVQLIEQHRYWDAADVTNTRTVSIQKGVFTDGNFEHKELSTRIGFGWQIQSEPGSTRIELSKEKANSGSRSLSVMFTGVANDETEFVKQLVLLEPGSSYRLTFAARSFELESDGPPAVSVIEAGPSGRVLVASHPSFKGTTDWNSYEVEFTTSDNTQAAYVVLRRQKCQTEVCPIFGTLWLDNFSLTKL